jgi:hypothetical protein
MLHTSGTFSSLVIGLANVSTFEDILDRIQTLTEAPLWAANLKTFGCRPSGMRRCSALVTNSRLHVVSFMTTTHPRGILTELFLGVHDGY